nr:7-carboxy-7-deazaguanine synthase [Candidatus Pantoea persica]
MYKQLPDGRKKVELNGFESADAAKGEIKKAFDAYKNEAAGGAVSAAGGAWPPASSPSGDIKIFVGLH